jgi:pimeloyl-ACP methyl ester carboxylesterase
MPLFAHDGLTFRYQEAGSGIPFVFQHGLGGDVSQPFGLFQSPPGFRLLAFDCRGHGATCPLGDPDQVRLARFAEDLAAFLDDLDIPQAVIGGISMGAAVALNFTLRFPSRTIGLVLSRPAWLNGPNRENARIFGQVARLIREEGVERGRELFQQSETYRDVLVQSPDNAASLLGQFDEPRAEEAVVRLERIPLDAPNHDPRDLVAVSVPTLVLASRQDVIHPLEFGTSLAQSIRGARFEELTSKSVDKDRHAADVQRCVGDFLQTHFGRP